MRFRFCGGLEPPDWLLAEISLLTKLDPPQVTHACEKISEDADQHELERFLQETFPNTQDAQAAVAVLRFVVMQSAKYDVSDRDLAIELLQLGLSSEIASTIASVYAAKRVAVRELLRSSSFKFPTIEQLRWRVHDGENSGDAATAKEKRVEMHLQLNRPPVYCDAFAGTETGKTPSALAASKTLRLAMSEAKFLALYEELTQAQSILQSLKH